MKFKHLKQSKKILLHIVIFDFLFLAVSYLLVQLFNNLVGTQYNRLLAINYDTIAQQSAEQIQAVSSTMQGVLFILILLIIVFIILMLVNWSFFQGLIYSKLTNKKFKTKNFLKFLLLNLGWIPAFIILLLIVQKGIKYNLQLVMTVIILVLFIYFTNILYISFMKNNRLSAVKQSFRIGVFKFYRLIAPCALLAAILIGLRQLNILFQSTIINLPIMLIIKQIPVIILALIAVDLTRIYIARAIAL